MDSRRDFLKKTAMLSGSAAMMNFLPSVIQKAAAINPALGSTYLDAEHVVILMQENRSFDHCFGTLQGVRGFNDPRAIRLPDQKPVWFQTDATGNTYAPFRLDIRDTKITWMGSLPHSRASQVDAYNAGKYDQWLIAKKSGNKKYATMPLTLGYYTREDLPFNYGMADAFTVCDQNFCSAMTSTTPNRSFFWSGKITHDKDGLPQANIRNTDYAHATMPWETFPELLEQNGVSWKFYQNEISCGGGFAGEERSWLANYGCNALEFFKKYNVKFSERYIAGLQKQVASLPAEIDKLQEASPSDEATAKKNREAIKNKQEALDNARNELAKWNRENYEKLTPQQKNLFRNAFVNNANDPDYRSLSQIKYMDGTKERVATVPKGDLLHQFRADVKNGQLPTVSWLAGPQNFSDHPSAPWYGAWYVSEILDILTKNPEVWKKTIFIVTYDENDGYYDHIPPFSIPDAKLPGTGKVSAGIETEIEQVRLDNEVKQGVPKTQAREAPIGLGFRVPMLIASPWSRGGQVCSEVFDHTSTLQFLETFVNKKFKKNIKLGNISEWRRTICGDLTSAFVPYNGAQLEAIPFLDRDKKVEAIYNAKFKEEPTVFTRYTQEEIDAIARRPTMLSAQEKGIRTACALPYELYCDAQLDSAGSSLKLKFESANVVFGKRAAGAPFTAAVPVKFMDGTREEIGRNWSFAVTAGDQLNYSWPLDGFENKQYNVVVNGPNGFFRQFKGDQKLSKLSISCSYERSKMNPAKLTGNVLLSISNRDNTAHNLRITDLGYKTGDQKVSLAANQKVEIVVPANTSHNWYDFSVRVEGSDVFEQRFAGKVETGAATKTDPVMGGMI